MKPGAAERGSSAAIIHALVALACALFAALAVAAAPASAESGDAAPIRPLSDGGLSSPDITGGIHLTRGATLRKGKVMKQFHAPGSHLRAQTPVAVKLGK